MAVIEKELIGGECGYRPCIPSKTLLRPTQIRGEADRAAGVEGARLGWRGLRDYRDYMVRNLDDSDQIRSYEHSGATVIKAAARITAPGTVHAGGRTLTAEHVIIGTGSQPIYPPVEGLDDVTVWTNRDATNVRDTPERGLLIGGSAVGVELGSSTPAWAPQSPSCNAAPNSGSAAPHGRRGLVGRSPTGRGGLGEIWFGIIQRQAIYRGTFASVQDLNAKTRGWNGRCHPSHEPRLPPKSSPKRSANNN